MSAPQAVTGLPPGVSATPIGSPSEKSPTSHRLSTLQRNAIAQFLNRRDFSAKDIAAYDYQVIANLPKIGKKGIVAIRNWLCSQGLDLKNIPAEQSESSQRRHQEKLDHAIRLLEKNGYRVFAPK